MEGGVLTPPRGCSQPSVRSGSRAFAQPVRGHGLKLNSKERKDHVSEGDLV